MQYLTAGLHPSSPFDLHFQSQVRSIKRNMELVEDIPPQYDVGNLGSDHFDSIDRHLMDSEVDPIGAGSDGESIQSANATSLYLSSDNCSATSAGMTVMAAPLSTRAGQRSETRVSSGVWTVT